ncbi:hypothetical protein MJ567_16570 [Escherichia coli]|nr:hypothetical protein MJ567_16570 [Escherichia coli]
MGTYTIAPGISALPLLRMRGGAGAGRFHFQLETPRWAVLTAAIVAAGPAFAAGGEP